MQIFVDESGSSGADIHDPMQPIYAIAAVWLDDSVRERVESLVDDIRTSGRLRMPELKGAKLIKSSRGLYALERLTKGCVDLGIEISLSAQHKAFLAASVVVEDCTDHLFNRHFDVAGCTCRG